MDTTKKIIIGAIGAAVVVGAVSIGLIFGLAPADTDLSTIHTQEATSVPEATEPATVEESSSVQESETVKEGTTGISVQLETYSSGNISIQYPVVSQMNDSAKQDNVNELLKTNARHYSGKRSDDTDTLARSKVYLQTGSVSLLFTKETA